MQPALYNGGASSLSSTPASLSNALVPIPTGGRLPGGGGSVPSGAATDRLRQIMPFPPTNQSVPTQFNAFSGTTNVTANSNIQGFDESNDQRSLRTLVAREWMNDNTAPPPKYGDATPYLSHDKQFKEGDLVFVYTRGKGHENTTDRYKTDCAELAKVNEVMAKEHVRVHARLKSERCFATYLANYNTGNSEKDREVVVAGTRAKEVVTKIFLKRQGIDEEEDLKIMEKSFYQLVMEGSRLFDKVTSPLPSTPAPPMYDASGADEDGGCSDSESSSSSEDEYSSLMTSHNWCEMWPTEAEVFRLHRALFPEKTPSRNGALFYPDEDVEESDREVFLTQLQATRVADLDILDNMEESFRAVNLKQKRAIKRLYKGALTELLALNENYVYYCTLPGVLNSWNFFGVLNNTGDGNSPGQLQKGNSHILNCIVENEARTTNRWGHKLPPMTRVYIKVMRQNFAGPFQYIPWNSSQYLGSNMNDRFRLSCMEPLPGDLEFTEMNGCTQSMGHAIFIGTVRYKYEDCVNEDLRRIANGLVHKNDTHAHVGFPQALAQKNAIALEKMLLLVKAK